jgi:hypothetical protein
VIRPFLFTGFIIYVIAVGLLANKPVLSSSVSAWDRGGLLGYKIALSSSVSAWDHDGC